MNFEELYAQEFAALAKREGHKRGLPQNQPVGKRSEFTVKERILNTLQKGGEKTTTQLAYALNKTTRHIAGEMSELVKSGAINKRNKMFGGYNIAHWSIK